jgi:hypothetical protein
MYKKRVLFVKTLSKQGTKKEGAMLDVSLGIRWVETAHNSLRSWMLV